MSNLDMKSEARALVAIAALFLGAYCLMGSGQARGTAEPKPITVCELSANLPAYRGKTVAVRGIYYYGLRQKCPNTCVASEWPSLLDIVGAGNVDKDSWEALGKAELDVERRAKDGTRFELWVTLIGKLRTTARPSPLGPCDPIGSDSFGYGHLGVFPGEIEVQRITDIEVRVNPKSAYDYSNMYHGPA